MEQRVAWDGEPYKVAYDGSPLTVAQLIVLLQSLYLPDALVEVEGIDEIRLDATTVSVWDDGKRVEISDG